MIDYRPEIDGLRAFAVAAVVLYHFGFSSFSGGFVGVDVFFVISGYLITTLVVSSCKTNTFSLIDFYGRRIRRIVPALTVVLAASTLAAFVLISPADLVAFGKDCIAAIFFASNLLYLRQAGYFDIDSTYKPLLHIWSLAVEEQFYLLFPLLAILLAKLRPRLQLACLVTLIVVSFGFAQYFVGERPVIAFFGTPMRVWELLVGSFCAVIGVHYSLRPSSLGAAIGLMLICVGVFTFSKATPMPSFWTLFPVIGAALVIVFAGKTEVVGITLSSSPAVGLGKISYSLYLWHLPLIVFIRISFPGTFSNGLILALLLTSVLLAILTWFYIEQPFRKRGDNQVFSQRSVAAIVVSSAVLLASISSMFVFSKGFPERSNSFGHSYSELRFEERFLPNLGFGEICARGFTLLPQCATTNDAKVLVWGDSYAMHIAKAITGAVPKSSGVRQISQASCNPVLDVAAWINDKESNNCISNNSKVESWLKEKPGIETVILSARWGNMVDEGTFLLTSDGNKVKGGPEVTLLALQETVRRLKSYGLRVVIISPTPSKFGDIGRCLQRALWTLGTAQGCEFNVESYPNYTKRAFEVLRRLDNIVPVIWLDKLLCNQQICRPSIDGLALYRDTGHFTIEGTEWLANNAAFRSELNDALKQ